MAEDWLSLSPSRAAELLAGYPGTWWVAGGWAVDLFLGEQTRPHADMDIALWREEQPLLRAHFSSWDIRVAHDGKLTPWRDGDWLSRPRHQFWARPRGQEAWALETSARTASTNAWLSGENRRCTRLRSISSRMWSRSSAADCPGEASSTGRTATSRGFTRDRSWLAVKSGCTSTAGGPWHARRPRTGMARNSSRGFSMAPVHRTTTGLPPGRDHSQKPGGFESLAGDSVAHGAGEPIPAEHPLQ